MDGRALDVRQVLGQRPPMGHRHHLQAAADPEDGKPALARAPVQRQLGLVARGPWHVRGLVRLGAVAAGIHVGAADEREPVEPVEDR